MGSFLGSSSIPPKNPHSLSIRLKSTDHTLFQDTPPDQFAQSCAGCCSGPTLCRSSVVPALLQNRAVAFSPNQWQICSFLWFQKRNTKQPAEQLFLPQIGSFFSTLHKLQYYLPLFCSLTRFLLPVLPVIGGTGGPRLTANENESSRQHHHPTSSAGRSCNFPFRLALGAER